MPRVFTIEHNHGTAAGLQYAPHFGNRGFGIRGVMQNAVRIHDIECAIRKRKIFRITLEGTTTSCHIAHQVVFCLGRTRPLHCDIDTRHIGTMFRKQRRMATCAGPNFQNCLSRQFTQWHIGHRHMSTQTKHVFQIIQRFQQIFTTNGAIDVIVKRLIERTPKGSNIRFCVDRFGHKLASEIKA